MRERKEKLEVARVKARIQHLGTVAQKTAFSVEPDCFLPEVAIWPGQSISLEDAAIFMPPFVAATRSPSLPELCSPRLRRALLSG